MTAAVIGNHSVTPSFVRTRMYGANVREEADDGLFEAVKANRAYRKQVAAKREEAQSVQRAKAEQEAYDESVEGIDEQISKARRRRQWLKEELEKAELLEAALMKKKKQKALDVKKKVKERENAKEALERKRKAAFARKLEESGGKPGGVTKSISPKKAPASMQRKYGG
jgi:predicted RNase H-like nuclease (RuvC/YqgF family)